MVSKLSAVLNFKLNVNLNRLFWNFHINTELEPLLAQIANQHEPSLKRLYQLTNANLFALALRILQQRDLAEDCLQLAFVKVWHNSQQFNATKAKPLAYFDGLAHPQVAAQLNLPLGSVKTWIRRGLLGLRECLTHII